MSPAPARHALGAHGLGASPSSTSTSITATVPSCCAGDERILMCGTLPAPVLPLQRRRQAGGQHVQRAAGGQFAAAKFRDAVNQVWMPRLKEFKPQAHHHFRRFRRSLPDDAGGANWSEKDYAWCTDELKKIAAQYSEKRIVSMLEGGYVMTSLARSVGAHLRSLAKSSKHWIFRIFPRVR